VPACGDEGKHVSGQNFEDSKWNTIMRNEKRKTLSWGRVLGYITSWQ